MTNRITAIFLALAVCAMAQMEPPRAGPVEIMPSSEIQAGMQGTAWTVFEGTEPEAVPVEIVGLWKNAWGPKQDIILGKLGGKAAETNVAGGMSGSPVYIDGRLAGAISLRISTFSPDAICGITPIELMLELNEFDEFLPGNATTPTNVLARNELPVPGDVWAQAVGAGGSSTFPARRPVMTPIDTPLTFSGFYPGVLERFRPVFDRMGMSVVQGGATGALRGSTPADGWEDALQPGQAVTGVLVSGDISITGLGTVTYNDGERVLAFGHSFFNLGPIEMPLSEAEILMVLSSQLEPNKFGNATNVVGALRQDRHSGIMGVLGNAARTIPVSLKVRSFDRADTVQREQDFNFDVFVHPQWTPYLMLLTMFNSISGLNDFGEDTTYRLSGEVELDGHPSVTLSTMRSAGNLQAPASLALAGWWAEKFTRLYLSPGDTPRLTRVNATVDLLPEERVATIESAWAALSDVEPGSDVPVKVFLRPSRGERIERDVTVHIPAGLPSGRHRILFSGADILNRMQQAVANINRRMELPQAVSLMNQERSNNQLYVSLLESRPTVYYEDKALPSLPGSIASVMQPSPTGNRQMLATAQSAQEQMAVPFDLVVEGSYSLEINVR